jgi:hypothetical protein
VVMVEVVVMVEAVVVVVVREDWTVVMTIHLPVAGKHLE